MTSEHPILTQEQVDAMDETAGIDHDIELPVRHGGDLRALAAFPAPIADGLARGSMSLDLEGWDD